MKAKIILDAMNSIANIPRDKSALDAYTSIMFDIRENVMVMWATNEFITVGQKIDHDLSYSGHVILGFKYFYTVMKMSGKDSSIDFNANGAIITPEGYSQKTYHISSIDPTSFVDVSGIKIKNGKKIPGDTFLNVSRAKQFCNEKDKVRSFLQNPWLVGHEGSILVGTDGFSIYEYKISDEMLADGKIPIPSVFEIYSENDIEMCEYGNYYIFKADNWIARQLKMASVLPDYYKVMEGMDGRSITMDKREALDAMKVPSFYASQGEEIHNFIELKIEDSIMKISGVNPANSDTSVDSVAIKNNGVGNCQLYVKPRLLKSSIDICTSDTVEIQISEDNRMMFHTGIPSERVLVMPMKSLED